MSKSIDLGRKLGDMVPIGAIAADQPHYPDLYLSDVDDLKLADMPDKGEATIKYRVVSRTHREEKGPDGKKQRSCSLRLEILSITPPEKARRNNGYGDDARASFRNNFK
jgi:hypothetical protein